MNLFPIIERKKNLAVYLVYVIAFCFSLQNYQYTFNNSTSIDLLYRVVGSRLMEDGKSPYYDKWRAGDPSALRYYHPVPRYSQEINGVTVTPGFLWINGVFAEANFCQARNWWFYLQIAVMFLCGLVLLISFKDFVEKIVTLAGFSFFFVYSKNFHLHIHSAQVYVIYSLIFSLLYLILKSNVKRKYLYTGLLMGIGVWLKPFFIVLYIPFLFRKNKEVFQGGLIVFFLVITQVILTGQAGYWVEYVSAMARYADDIRLSSQPDFLQLVPPNFEVPSCIYPMKYPNELPLDSTGLRSVQYYLFRMGIDFSEPKAYGMGALVLIMGIALYTRKKNLIPEQLVALLFLMYVTLELFTPALRFGYYLVQWAAVSIVVLASYRRNKIAAVVMTVGLLINHGFIPFPDVYEGMAGELMMIVAMMIFVVCPYRITKARKVEGGIADGG